MRLLVATERLSLGRHQEANDQTEQTQDGAENLDDKNLDEAVRRKCVSPRTMIIIST
jgi:hypothetical protein